MQTIKDALGRLEGVKGVEAKSKTNFEVRILEDKAILPATFEKTVKDAGYQYRGATVQICGTAAKEGDTYTLTARASGQKFTLLKPSDALKQLVADGKTKVMVSGKYEQPKEKDGKLPPPTIEVKEAGEAKEASK